MHILLTTYGLLLIFALYCSAQWRSAVDMAFIDAVAIERFMNFRKIALDDVSNKTENIYKKYNRNKAPKATSRAVTSKVNSTEHAPETALLEEDDDEEEAPLEPPDQSEDDNQKKTTDTTRTAYLHIGDLFTGENPTITEGKGKASFTLLKNLMGSMYGDQKFYKEAKESVPDFEDQFLLNLFERAKEEQENKQWITEVGHLSAIELDDELQSYIRYKILTGNKSRLSKDNEDEPGYFPLIQFTSMNKRKTLMSIWRAPKPLLMALFQNPEVVQDVIETRRDMYRELRKDHSPSAKEAKEKELRLRFGAYIPDFAEYIDFQVCTTRPPNIPLVKRAKKPK